MVVGGSAILVANDGDDCGSYDLDCSIDDGLRDIAGALLVIGGVVGLVITMAVNANKPPPAPEAPVAATYSRPSDLVPLPASDPADVCTPAVREWLRETDPKRKTERYEALPASCRAQITRPEVAPAS